MINDATLRVESRFKNARLYRAIQEASLPVNGNYNRTWEGGKVLAFCLMHELSRQQVYRLLNLRDKPVGVYTRDRVARVRPICLRLAEILNKEVEWLFPRELYEIEWPAVLVREVDARKFVSLSAAKSALMLPPSQEETAEREILKKRLAASIGTLTARERNVVRKRYGLDQPEETLIEVAQSLGVSTERVRQIECKALRKLRHPSRSRSLKPFVTK